MDRRDIGNEQCSKVYKGLKTIVINSDKQDILIKLQKEIEGYISGDSPQRHDLKGGALFSTNRADLSPTAYALKGVIESVITQVGWGVGLALVLSESVKILIEFSKQNQVPSGGGINRLECEHVTFLLAGCILQNLLSNKQRGGKRNKTKRGGTLRKKRNIRKFRKTNRS
jgi:hypothetical protein